MGDGEDALVSSFPGQVIFSPFELSSMEVNTMLLFDKKNCVWCYLTSSQIHVVLKIPFCLQ